MEHTVTTVAPFLQKVHKSGVPSGRSHIWFRDVTLPLLRWCGIPAGGILGKQHRSTQPLTPE
ncbi:MAG: hypothetical protein CSA34_07675 [Desulfobulbus propionicus]|nr:MAG: hypothetical protein CSA34_07675 [Desulfobulbus propionicus]